MIAGPGRDEIAAFWDAPTHQPVRIYVGLTASETVEERAKLAFDELRRVGGFERKYLILATPTGSAWLDPGAMDTLEAMGSRRSRPKLQNFPCSKASASQTTRLPLFRPNYTIAYRCRGLILRTIKSVGWKMEFIGSRMYMRST